MHTMLKHFTASLRTLALGACTLAAAAALALSPAQAVAAKAAQKTFATPEDAVKAIVEVLAAQDRKALKAVLGPHSEGLLSSGDAVADRKIGEKFLALYNESHKVEMVGEGKAILQVGKNDWPLPIPLVRQGEAWRFDTAAAREEILDRRIGRNELFTIQTVLAIVDAQQDYAAKDRNGDGLLAYAQKFHSSPGKQDGLYWPTKAGEEQSPLGPLAAQAAAEGYRRAAGGKPQPYHGYYFRILTGQGQGAPGGAYDYLVKKEMIGGFGVLAWPAKYGNSGVMSFIANHEGVVWQKDLGPKTASVAAKISRFDPAEGWTRVEQKEPVR